MGNTTPDTSQATIPSETPVTEQVRPQTETSQQPPVLTPQQPKEPATPSKSKKWLLPLIIIIVVLLMGVVSFFIYRNFQSKQETSRIQPTPSPVATLPTPTTNPTASWETYSNTTHNVAFKYPPRWTLTDEKGQIERGITYNTQVKLSIENTNITMYFNMDGIGGMPQNYEGTPFVLDGNNLYQYNKVNNYNNTKLVGISNSLDTLGVFMLNNVTYSITLEYPLSYGEAKEAELLNEFNKIISTFKFTNSDLNNKEEVSLALENYLTALIDGDENTAISYLSQGVKENATANDFVSMYESYTIWEGLNEFHSDEEENLFYNQDSITFNVKFYREDDKSGNLAKVIFIKENGNWKTISWYLFQ